MKLAVLIALIMGLSMPAISQEYSHVWYVNDGPDVTYRWEDTSMGSFWERMYPTAIEEGDIICATADIPDGTWAQAYYAATYSEISTYSNCHFWAVLFLNNVYAANEPVHVSLGTANPATMTFTSLVGPVSQTVTNQGPLCQPYTFDFGIVPPISLDGESLALEITQSNLEGGYPQIVWESECCPTGLYAECSSPVRDGTWGAVKALYR